MNDITKYDPCPAHYSMWGVAGRTGRIASYEAALDFMKRTAPIRGRAFPEWPLDPWRSELYTCVRWSHVPNPTTGTVERVPCIDRNVSWFPDGTISVSAWYSKHNTLWMLRTTMPEGAVIDYRSSRGIAMLALREDALVDDQEGGIKTPDQRVFVYDMGHRGKNSNSGTIQFRHEGGKIRVLRPNALASPGRGFNNPHIGRAVAAVRKVALALDRFNADPEEFFGFDTYTVARLTHDPQCVTNTPSGRDCYDPAWEPFITTRNLMVALGLSYSSALETAWRWRARKFSRETFEKCFELTRSTSWAMRHLMIQSSAQYKANDRTLMEHPKLREQWDKVGQAEHQYYLHQLGTVGYQPYWRNKEFHSNGSKDIPRKFWGPRSFELRETMRQSLNGRLLAGVDVLGLRHQIVDEWPRGAPHVLHRAAFLVEHNEIARYKGQLEAASRLEADA